MKTLLIYSALLVLAGCASEPTTTPKTETPQVSETTVTLTREQIRNTGITLAQPETMKIGATLRVTGTVEVPPQNKTAISFPFGGFVKSVPVLDGMHVKKGQVLLTLEDPAIIQLQQDYLEAMSQLEFLEQEYKRQEELGNQQVNSGKTVQQAKANYRSTLARCKGMGLKLELAGLNPSQVAAGNLQRAVSIRAPFSGVVTKMNAAIGHYATAQEVLLEIIDTKHAHIELFAFEKDVAHLEIGQKVHVKLSNRTETQTGTIYLVGKEIGADRMVKLHCHLDREDADIIPGSFVQGTIDLTNVPQLTVPNEAIVNKEGKSVVFLEKSSADSKTVYALQEIEVLGEENGRTAFRYQSARVDPQQPVVVKGAYGILSAMLLTKPE